MTKVLAKKCWCGGRVRLPAWGEAGDLICLDSEYHDPTATGRRNRHTKLYVPGPMSGYPENNYPAFHEAARLLRSAGYEVCSPAEFGAGGVRVHYVDLLREDLRAMLDNHGVCVLERWWESAGARNEVQVAGILQMPVRTVPEWLERAALELDPTREAFDGQQ